MIKTTILGFALIFTVLLVSCEKDGDVEKAKYFAQDSLYFSCTINNKFLEFKSQPGHNFEYSLGAYGQGESNLYPKDTIILFCERIFENGAYRIKFSFSDSAIIVTDSPLPETSEIKDKLFRKGNYPLQFHSLNDYSIERPTPLYLGFNIDIYDKLNHVSYSSSVDYYMNKKTAKEEEYINFKTSQVFQITDLYKPFKASGEYYLPFLNPAHIRFIEANLKCNLYISGDIEKKISISDGVLRGCF